MMVDIQKKFYAFVNFFIKKFQDTNIPLEDIYFNWNYYILCPNPKISAGDVMLVNCFIMKSSKDNYNYLKLGKELSF